MRVFGLSTLIIGNLCMATLGVAAEDKTQEFQGFFVDRFVGKTSEAAQTWDNTTCIATNPLGGNCVERGGFVINGQAKGSVDQLVSVGGRGVILDVDQDPWTGAIAPYMRMQQNFVFHYSGESSAAQNCFPGNFRCDTPWASVHPTGKIYLDITANKITGFRIQLRYEVLAGHQDRPNGLLRSAMANLKDEAVSLIRSYQHANGCQQDIIVNEVQ